MLASLPHQNYWREIHASEMVAGDMIAMFRDRK